MVTTLRPGIVTIFRGAAREPVVVTGGFAEVGPARIDRPRRPRGGRATISTRDAGS